MTNETVEKAKADVRKGMAEVGKAAANLRDDVMVGVEKFKDHYEHNADVEKKTDATRILVNDADTGVRSDSEIKRLKLRWREIWFPFNKIYMMKIKWMKRPRPIQRSRGIWSNLYLASMQASYGKHSI